MPPRSTPQVDPPPALETSPPPGYEPRDANITAVSILAFVVALIVFLSQLGTWFWFRSSAIDNQPPRQSNQAQFQNSTEPPLQSDMYKDLQQFQADQARQLNSYGWIDRKQGIVRIPVSRAIDLMLECNSQSSSPSDSKPSSAK